MTALLDGDDGEQVLECYGLWLCGLGCCTHNQQFTSSNPMLGTVVYLLGP